MRILIIEDTKPLRSLFARLLKARGFEVHEACDGLAALNCLADSRPELVLTDLMRPRLGGLGFLRRLRAMPEWDAIPVVAMTAVATTAWPHPRIGLFSVPASTARLHQWGGPPVFPGRVRLTHPAAPLAVGRSRPVVPGRRA